MSSAGKTDPVGGGRVGLWLLAVALVSLVLGVVVLLGYALFGDRTEAPRAKAPGFERYEAAWSSAMAKAGVVATFPVEPVDIRNLRARGRHSFEATFTAEEISALLSVYRFETEIRGTPVAIGEAEVTFPSEGVASIDGRLLSGGSRYHLEAEAGLTYGAAEIRSDGLTSLKVEGFGVGGSKRADAGDAILRYLNDLLDEAPGLTIDAAVIVPGGLRASGWAPVMLETAEPASGD